MAGIAHRLPKRGDTPGWTASWGQGPSQGQSGLEYGTPWFDGSWLAIRLRPGLHEEERAALTKCLFVVVLNNDVVVYNCGGRKLFKIFRFCSLFYL